MKDNVTIFFAARSTARSRRDLFRFARMAIRRPVPAWRLFWLAVLRAVSGHRTHVAIGYRGAVLDPVFAGNRFWPYIAYVLAYPGLIDAFEVPVDRPIRLEDYEGGGRKAVWPTLIRWWTAGQYQTEDCVCIACDLLRQGGINVPRYIISPGQLHRWLTLRRHHHVILTG